MLTLAAWVLAPVTARVQGRDPIIDMHVHALSAAAQGPPPLGLCPLDPMPSWNQQSPYPDVFLQLFKKPPCADPIWSPLTDAEVIAQTIAVMQRLNVIGVLSGTPARVDAWMAAGPGRFIPGLALQIASADAPTLSVVRERHAQGKLGALAEVTNQYAGMLPDDPRMEPYWQLAETLDVPVGYHVGPGPPGVIYLGANGYRARLHSALVLEEVLVRHPQLRLYVMHAGYPMLDDMLTVLYAHPQVHVEVGVIAYTQPRAAFYRYLRGLVEGGFANRVMFGSDQMVWPAMIERAIAVINEAPFLSAAQKRDILYNNAARFLRLTKEEMSRHRGM